MIYSDMLFYLARSGPFRALRKSAFRKYCRKNVGQKSVIRCRNSFSMNTVIGDSVDNQIAVNGAYESGTSQVIECLAGESGCFLDVGCNIGYYSCLFGSKHPEKRLISIDPNPAMIERTKENLILNNITNYQLLNCGVGEQHGILTCNIPRYRASLSSVAYVPRKGGPIEAIEVSILTLREVILESSMEGCLVKIDTEGFEHSVFCGLTEDVVDRVKFIIFELSAANLKRAGKSAKDLLAIPIISEFDFYVVKDNTQGLIEKVDPACLAEDDRLNINALLIRKDLDSNRLLRRTSIRHY